MLSTDLPARFPIPFGNAAADIRAIPSAHQTPTGTDAPASLTDGWPHLTSLPIASGGIPPNIADANGLEFQVTAGLRWIQAGGQAYFNSAFVAANGGYPAGAVLASTTLGRFWQSTVDNNTTDPDGGSPANWTAIIGAGSGPTPDPPGGESVTLPNGTILKSNTIFQTLNSQGLYSFNFATPFPNACRGVRLVALNTSAIGSSDGHCQLVGFNANSFSVMPQDTRTGGVAYIDGISWEASGY